MLTLTYSLADQNFATTKSLGILNLSVRLLEHLAQRPELHALTVLSNRTLAGGLRLPELAKVVRHDAPIAGRFTRLWWDQWGVYRAARQTRNQWLFLPKGFASFLCPCPVRLAVYVHDVILDFYERSYPRGVSRLERCYFQSCFRANLRQARIIFTNSEFTRSEVERAARRYALPLPPVRAIGMGFTAPPVPAGARPERIVVLASPLPHKRTNLAHDYFRRWQTQTDYSGVVDWVGRWPAGLTPAAHSNWRCHPRLPEPEYQDLLRQARVLVFFSEYEGFGMPPVESLLGGTCPVYSDIPATREVMAGAGCPFVNESYESFVRALDKALRSPISQLDAWAQQLAQRYDWDKITAMLAQKLVECDQQTATAAPVGPRLRHDPRRR